MDLLELEKGYKTAYVDSAINSNLAYRPEFVSNNYEKGNKVLATIEQELLDCDEFIISVAFITLSGVTPLLQTLKTLESRGIKGKILTTDYLGFSEPAAIEKLNNLTNVEIRMYRANSSDIGFHTKGYIFKKGSIYKVVIGSSNMTLNALTKNHEWNTKIVSTEYGSVICDILDELNSLWDSKNTLEYDDFIEEYRDEYIKRQIIKRQQEEALKEKIVDLERYKLEPNKMQVSFIQRLKELVDNNNKKGLLLSATGTGKTYASAFALRELNVKRVLFVVHREQIAIQSRESYKKVFGSSKTYGLVSGSHKEFDKDFVFATMQMMSKYEILNQFKTNDFDIVVLDECHHAGNNSYQTIMQYFEPRFWLGMTASPDTNNYDIYSIFDHNIAYEIRLQQALEEDLLCPFHYFGIADMTIDYKHYDEKTGFADFNSLISDDRVNYVMDNAKYFGYSGNRVKGLVFCSRKDEAKELSQKFNEKGLKTEVLTGEDSQSKREQVIELLTAEDTENYLDYVFTVDIFNEGVDIPEINQVILLRPTQSPVVFVQQLGRGLRKHQDKEFVVILDFIGNYTNNYMIPIALSGDTTYNKDNLRMYVAEGARCIPGSSTVHFDEISKSKIYSAIDSAKTEDTRIIKEAYTALKNKLGRIPKIAEFKQFGYIDITKIFNKFGSYYAFLKRYEKDYYVNFSKEQSSVLEFLSKKVVQCKRIFELELLKELVTSISVNSNEIFNYISRQYGIACTDLICRSATNVLSFDFSKDSDISNYPERRLIINAGNDTLKLSLHFEEMLHDSEFKQVVFELIDYGIERYKDKYTFEGKSLLYKDTCLKLYEKYSYEDVCRLLNWKKNANAQNLGGYFYDKETKTLPVFINYNKAEDAIAYEDRFISNDRIIALSKHPRRITSLDAKHFYKKGEEEKDNRIFLFVRKNKNDAEAKEFYFLGEINAEGEPMPIVVRNTNDDAFEINYKLEVPVRSDIYDYIVME